MNKNNSSLNRTFRIEVALSLSEPLPAVDVWLVLDLLRASTTIVTWFERGGREIYPEMSVDTALSLKTKMLKEGFFPLLMGEVNSIPPDEFDAGNSPLEIDEKIIYKNPTAIMATSNGTKAILKAVATGAAVYIVCARNALYAIDSALTCGYNIGILCAGRFGRPAVDDTICAGLIVERFCRILPDFVISDEADIALRAWKSARGSFEHSIRTAAHAKFLEKIGFGGDISYACEWDSAKCVPEVKEISDFCDSGLRPVITCERKGGLGYLSDEAVSFIKSEEQKQIKAAEEEKKVYKDKIKTAKEVKEGDIFFGGDSYIYNKTPRRNLDIDFGGI